MCTSIDEQRFKRYFECFAGYCPIREVRWKMCSLNWDTAIVLMRTLSFK